MATSDIARQLRLLLTNSPEAPSLPSFLETVDLFVTEATESQDLVEQLEEDLQTIYHELIDHSVSSQIKIFLSVLYHLRPILPPVSLISTWFDLVLRPALREPKLPVEAVTHAKELIVSALTPVKHEEHDANSDEQPDKEKRQEKVRDFRRRLMDLYLLDAFNESSGEDVLEWAELDDAQKERKACWKANLEDVLVRLGLQQPQVGLVSSLRTPFQSLAKTHARTTRHCSPSFITASLPLALDCSCSCSSMRIRLNQTSLDTPPSLQPIHSCRASSTP